MKKTAKHQLNCAVMIVTVALQAAIALGQSFAAGYTKYQKGDFDGALKVFRAALPTVTDTVSKAKIHKFIGISLYMKGDKSAADASFREAIKLQPQLKISPNEVLDEGVITAFNKQKLPPTPTLSEPPPSTATGETNRPETSATKTPPAPQRKTILRIQSNVPAANVMMSGIIAGNTNTPIEVDPGEIEIIVAAKGYKSRRIKSRAKENQETILTINLEPNKKKQKKIRKSKPQQTNDDEILSFDDKRGESYQQTPGDDLVKEFDREQVPPMPGYAESPYGPYAYQQPYRRMNQPPDPLISILPFGGGQFNSKRYALGSVIAVSQVGLIYFGYTEYRKSIKVIEQRDDRIDEREAAGQDLSDEDNEWIDRQTLASKKARLNASYSGIGFVTLWTIGIVDAVFYDRQMLWGSAQSVGKTFTGSVALRPQGGWLVSLAWAP